MFISLPCPDGHVAGARKLSSLHICQVLATAVLDHAALRETLLGPRFVHPNLIAVSRWRPLGHMHPLAAWTGPTVCIKEGGMG